jgi:pimeloyl-ACP methyl ester carboxylesterase
MPKHLTPVTALAALLAVFLLTAFATAATAAIEAYPAAFHTEMVPTNGTRLYVRVGGRGPAVVLLHGFGDTGDMWAPLAAVLVKNHTVIVPDLLAAQYPARVTRWVVIDAPLPGIGAWDKILLSPMLWHFNFRGPDEERLVQGRERIYLDRFYNELSADPKSIDEETRQHYATLYARPHAIHDAFEQFGAFNQDAIDNKALLAKVGKLTLPVLALGAEKSFGAGEAEDLRFVAGNVTGNVTGGIVPNSGHWIMEENPKATIKEVTDFLALGK